MEHVTYRANSFRFHALIGLSVQKDHWEWEVKTHGHTSSCDVQISKIHTRYNGPSRTNTVFKRLQICQPAPCPQQFHTGWWVLVALLYICHAGLVMNKTDPPFLTTLYRISASPVRVINTLSFSLLLYLPFSLPPGVNIIMLSSFLPNLYVKLFFIHKGKKHMQPQTILS